VGELDRFGEGKCITCGFLGKRDDRPSMAICYEASSFDRLTGDFTCYSGTVNTFATCIWCFVGEALFHQEMTKDGVTDTNYDRVHELIKKDRNCKSWYKWKEFRTPKEHYEELKMMQLEQSRKDFELRIEKERKEFDLKLFDLSQAIQKDSNEVVKKTDSFNRRMTLFIIILALLEVTGTLLALFFPNGF
jgi:hypothetical protein